MAPGTSGSLATAGMRRGDAFDPANAPNAPGVPRQLGSISSTAVATTPSITHEARAEVPMDQGFEADTRSASADEFDASRRRERCVAAVGPLVPITESPAAAPPMRAQAGAAVAPAPSVAPAPRGRLRVIPLTPQAPGATIAAQQIAPAAQMAALPPAASPKSEYEEGVGLLKQGQYDAAEKSFADFVAKNPKSALVPSAVSISARPIICAAGIGKRPSSS